MSRRSGWALLAGLTTMLAPVTAAAQSAGPGSAQEVIARESDPYGPANPRAGTRCPAPKPGDEIVVCAELEEQSQFRVKSSAALDPSAKGALGGVPRAPDFSKPCVPGPLTRCTRLGGAMPAPRIIDLKAIPDAPAGSDADRVGKGEKAE